MNDELKLTILKLLAAFHSSPDINARYAIKDAVNQLYPECIWWFR